MAVMAATTGRADALVERASKRIMPPFKPLDVRVTVGEIEIRATDRADIVIEVEREAPDVAGLARIPVDIADTEESLIVNVTQRDGGKLATLRARVVVLVPLVTAVRQVSVFEGRIGVSGLRGSIQARIERGPIQAEDLAGVVRLETVAGDLVIERSDLRADGLLRLRTFNGAIRIGLVRAPKDARVLLLTLSGGITSDLPLAERQGFGPRFREGTFGTAQPLLSADAVRGDISLTVAK
jgi:hypothetical protein